MKRIFAWVVAMALFCPFGLANASGRCDSILPTYPQASRRRCSKHRVAYPAYAIAAGVVAVALTGSLVALRVIRKRNGNGPS